MKQRLISLALGVLVGALVGTLMLVIPPARSLLGDVTETVGIAMPALEEVRSEGIPPEDFEYFDTLPTPGSQGPSETGGNPGGDNSGGGVGGQTGSGQGGGGSSAGDYYDPGGPEITAPENAGFCPQTRAENPAVYDSCRAGYVPPTIVGSITSCYPIDKSVGTWSVTMQWTAQGGNWKGHWNGGSTRTYIHHTTPGEASAGEHLMIGTEASITVTDMNGWGWKIDEVYGSFPGVPMNSVCR